MAGIKKSSASVGYQPPPPPPPPPPPDEPPPDELLLPELELEPEEGLGGGVEALAVAASKAPLIALGVLKRLLLRYHSGWYVGSLHCTTPLAMAALRRAVHCCSTPKAMA